MVAHRFVVIKAAATLDFYRYYDILDYYLYPGVLWRLISEDSLSHLVVLFRFLPWLPSILLIENYPLVPSCSQVPQEVILLYDFATGEAILQSEDYFSPARQGTRYRGSRAALSFNLNRQILFLLPLVFVDHVHVDIRWTLAEGRALMILAKIYTTTSPLYEGLFLMISLSGLFPLFMAFPWWGGIFMDFKLFCHIHAALF